MKDLLLRIIFCACLCCSNICAAFDLDLAEAEQLWQQKNRELKTAADQIHGAVADKLSAAQRPNPQLSLNTTSIQTGDPGFIKQADSIIRIDQIIERGDKRALRERAASLRLDASQDDLSDAQRQGLVALYRAYYDVVLAQQQLQIARENAQLSAQMLMAAQWRLKAGDVARADVDRLQVDMLRAEDDAQQAKNNLLQMQLALAYQLGLESQASALHASAHWPAVEVMPAQPIFAVEQRADVLAAEKRAQAAQTAFEQAQALRKRDVTVGMQVEHNGQNRPLNTVGIGVSVPLMTGYEYAGEIAHARADLELADDALDQTRARALIEIQKAFADLMAAREQIQRFDNELLQAAQRALDAAEFAYKHGAGGIMDVLDARRTHKAILNDAASAHANYAKALATWHFVNSPFCGTSSCDVQ